MFEEFRVRFDAGHYDFLKERKLFIETVISSYAFVFLVVCPFLYENFRDPLQFVSNRNSHGHVSLTLMFLQPSALICSACIGRDLHRTSGEVLNSWKQSTVERFELSVCLLAVHGLF